MAEAKEIHRGQSQKNIEWLGVREVFRKIKDKLELSFYWWDWDSWKYLLYLIPLGISIAALIIAIKTII